MRILIVGAGIGGMTLAALLDRRGERPDLVERAPDLEHAGYMLGLYSLGYRVLRGLGLYEQFAAASVPVDQYEVLDGDGDAIQHWSMTPFTDRFGPVLSSSRPQLVELLRGGLGAVTPRFGVAAVTVDQRDDEVRVDFSDGTSAAYDLVVAADGLGSRVRDRLIGEQPGFDTGWGGWVWWADAALVAPRTFCEYWGAGRFLGAYPTTRGLGIFAGGPAEAGFDEPGPGRRDRLRAHLAGMGARVDAIVDAVPDDAADLFFWRLRDVRAESWRVGRVVLLGDAAAGFLPTAGIGASMAMESAAVLADELSRADAATVEQALDYFVARRRARVERIQDDSRKLARMMFVESRTISAIRNVLARFYSVESLAKGIAHAFEAPI